MKGGRWEVHEKKTALVNARENPIPVTSVLAIQTGLSDIKLQAMPPSREKF